MASDACLRLVTESRQKAWKAHLAAAAQQLIVNGDARHPLALAALLGSSHRQQGHQIGGCLVAMEGDAGQIHLARRLGRVLGRQMVVGIALDCATDLSARIQAYFDVGNSCCTCGQLPA